MISREPFPPISAACPYVEDGKRGHYIFRVEFTRINQWHINIWPTIPNKTGSRRGRRGIRKATRALKPVIDLWAKSEYKYTMDLEDFVIAILGKPGKK